MPARVNPNRKAQIEPQVAILLPPLGEVGDRVTKFLPRRSAYGVRLAGTIFVAPKLEREKAEPQCATLAASTEVNQWNKKLLDMRGPFVVRASDLLFS